MFKPPWQQPYPSLSKLPPKEVQRITVELLRADGLAVCSIIPTPGILSLIAQHAIKATAEYVRRHNLTYADAEDVIHWICKRTFSEPSQKATAHDVTGRGALIRARVKELKDVATSAGEEVESAGGNKGSGTRRRRD